mmetsp:Transcript_20174/g.29674  ORF Transcript_20174/g.29674 Transcript_20174/m.29674 type:complete len:258 (-) Transcript_20174:1538-2311(-)
MAFLMDLESSTIRHFILKSRISFTVEANEEFADLILPPASYISSSKRQNGAAFTSSAKTSSALDTFCNSWLPMSSFKYLSRSGFCTNLFMPTLMPRWASSLSACAEIPITNCWNQFRCVLSHSRYCWIQSTPSIIGMRKSQSTISYTVPFISSKPTNPFSACLTSKPRLTKALSKTFRIVNESSIISAHLRLFTSALCTAATFWTFSTETSWKTAPILRLLELIVLTDTFSTAISTSLVVKVAFACLELSRLAPSAL